MATETIDIEGHPTLTLCEMLRPGLKGVFVGLNPSPVSVAKGHYYQGRLGRALWQRLQRFGVTGPLRPGSEDEDAFAQGFGFVDLIRLPTARESGLSLRQKASAASDLIKRLCALPDRPVIVFVFKAPCDLTGPELKRKGFTVMRMPGPYDPADKVAEIMHQISSALSRKI
jgi:double-stranded uracil-DNA glycosylase